MPGAPTWACAGTSMNSGKSAAPLPVAVAAVRTAAPTSSRPAWKATGPTTPAPAPPGTRCAARYPGPRSRVQRFGEAFRGELSTLQAATLFGSWQLRDEYDASLIYRNAVPA